MSNFFTLLIIAAQTGFLLNQELIKDIDGNIYSVKTIGTQQWMAENLKVTHYNDGTIIPFVLDNETWSLTKEGAYCVSNEKSHYYKDTYGALYNFYAVIDSRKICPDGWHVPTANEWEILINFLGGVDAAGKQMRKTDTNLWQFKLMDVNNSIGFSAVPAGGRGRMGSFGEVGFYATWWSSTSEDSIFAWHYGLYPNKNNIRYNPGHKASGFSVRCIKSE